MHEEIMDGRVDAWVNKSLMNMINMVNREDMRRYDRTRKLVGQSTN